MGAESGLRAEDLAAGQLAGLNRTLAWAREQSPFYRERLGSLPPEPLASLAEVAELPFTTPEDLREQGGRMVCVSQGEVARVVSLPTSGTTAPAKRLYFSPEDLELTLDFFHHGMSTLVQPGQRVLILLPGEAPDSVGDLLARGLERLGVTGVPCGPVQDLEACLEVMRLAEVHSLVGIPTQVLALAARAALGDRPPRELTSVLLTTDYVPRSLAARVAEAWGVEVFEHWGMTETGLGGAVMCRAREGSHVRALDLYCEVVDPASGRVLPAGEEGELVITTLTRRALPLVRYRTGDLTRLLAGRCACGSLVPRLARVRGRVAVGLSLGAGKVLRLHELDEVLFALPWLLDYRATARPRPEGWGLELEVRTTEPAPGESELGAGVTRALAGLPAARGGRLVLERMSLAPAGWPTSGVGKRVLCLTEEA